MLIEVRIGPGKRKLTSSVLNVKHRCRVQTEKIHRVPHITLYGGFIADYSQVQRIRDAITGVGKKYSFLPYLVDGCKWVEGEKGK